MLRPRLQSRQGRRTLHECLHTDRPHALEEIMRRHAGRRRGSAGVRHARASTEAAGATGETTAAGTGAAVHAVASERGGRDLTPAVEVRRGVGRGEAVRGRRHDGLTGKVAEGGRWRAWAGVAAASAVDEEARDDGRVGGCVGGVVRFSAGVDLGRAGIGAV